MSLYTLEFFSQTHVLRNFCTQPPLRNLSFSGTFSLSSNRALFSTNIAPVTVSRLRSMCSTHNLKASSTSGLVTILAFLADSAVGVAASLSWSFWRPFLVKWRERDAWSKMRAPSRRFRKCLTVASCETGWFWSYHSTTCSQSPSVSEYVYGPAVLAVRKIYMGLWQLLVFERRAWWWHEGLVLKVHSVGWGGIADCNSEIF